MRPAETFLPTRSLGPWMVSLVRTAIPELSGGLLRMRVLAVRNIMSSPLPRATMGSKIEPPPISALPPNTASTAIAPWFTVVQVTLRFSSAKKPLSRATTSGVKLATPITAIRTFAGGGFACASAACGARPMRPVAKAPAIIRVHAIDRSPLARLSLHYRHDRRLSPTALGGVLHVQESVPYVVQTVGRVSAAAAHRVRLDAHSARNPPWAER